MTQELPGIIASLNSFKEDAFADWLYRLLFDQLRPDDPKLPVARGDTMDIALFDVYRALSPQSQRRFGFAVKHCLEGFPRDKTWVCALQILCQAVQFTVPPKAAQQLDYFLRTEYFCKAYTEGHGLRYWLLSARCLYPITEDLARYMLKTVGLENDPAYTTRCFVALAKIPSTAEYALDLLPTVFRQLSTNPAGLSRALRDASLFIEQNGYTRLTGWLSEHQEDLWADDTTHTGFKIWNDGMWQLAKDQLKPFRREDECEWQLFVRAVQWVPSDTGESGMDEMRTYIQKEIERLSGSGNAEDYYKAANNFRKRFHASGPDTLDFLRRSEEMPVTLKTANEVYRIGCNPESYKAHILEFPGNQIRVKEPLPA